ncbi:DNA integrity scanning protein DisA [Oxobacter pfennigii]|uniref:Diadenylate cyclase n=1 Tax=Oxobacter pfennigii TaxID=36849 RepID=A0A0P8WEY8_9CLOT|nr:diadenylate cyclase CdaA [Oxobacter pfennigii]KPU46326.1 DNA integrity scanning protein DisA [Oxobacter pfennigii]
MFETYIASLLSLLKHITIINIIDILIVSYIFYKLFMLISRTRAETLIKGLILILVIMKVSEFAGLITLYWIIQNTITVGFMALIIIFQPELRRALEYFGRSRFLSKTLEFNDEELNSFMTHIVEAVINLSSEKTGALIVIEQETGLNDYIESGVKLDAVISAQLLENIFVENTPLHDGAVIIRNNRIASAASFLPLTENYNHNKQMGTRHRAALGISENSDAIVIIVSEETGNISLAINGKLTKNYNAERLKDILIRIMKHRMSKRSMTLWGRAKAWIRQKQGI